MSDYHEIKALETSDPERYAYEMERIRQSVIADRIRGGLPPLVPQRGDRLICGCTPDHAYTDSAGVVCCRKCETAEGAGWKETQAEQFTPRELESERER